MPLSFQFCAVLPSELLAGQVKDCKNCKHQSSVPHALSTSLSFAKEALQLLRLRIWCRASFLQHTQVRPVMTKPSPVDAAAAPQTLSLPYLPLRALSELHACCHAASSAFRERPCSLLTASFAPGTQLASDLLQLVQLGFAISKLDPQLLESSRRSL